MDLRAPNTQGVYTWETTTPARGPDLLHTDGVARLSVRVVSTSECLLAVVSRDADNQTPVQGLRVVAHPYLALLGVARGRVREWTIEALSPERTTSRFATTTN